MPLRKEDEHAEQIEAIYREKMNNHTPKYAPVVMRADVSRTSSSPPISFWFCCCGLLSLPSCFSMDLQLFSDAARNHCGGGRECMCVCVREGERERERSGGRCVLSLVWGRHVGDLFLPKLCKTFAKRTPPQLFHHYQQPGVVYMDAQMTKLLEKQEEVLAGQRKQGKEIAELKSMLETLKHAVSETNNRVAKLKDEIVPPLHNALHDNAEATLQTIAHYSVGGCTAVESSCDPQLESAPGFNP